MSWRKVKLKVVLEQVKIPVSIQDSVEYKLVTVSNKGEIRLRQLVKGYEISSEKAFKCLKSHFIYSRLSVHNGAFGIVPDDLEGALLTSEMPIFSINENIYPEFLIYSLQQPNFKNQIDDLTRGVGRTRVKENSFLNIEINLPPLSIQKQIINYLKLVGFQKNELNYEQLHQLDLLKKLRQQILKDAMQGKLVPQNPKDEPATKLLDKIKAEKAKSKKKEKFLPEIKPEEIPFEIPKSWVWCRLGALCKSISTGPFGTMLHKSDYVGDGIPLVNPMNIIDNKIVPSNKMMVDEKTKSRLKSYILKEGNIVIGRRGEMGRCAIITSQEDGWLCGTGSFFLELYPEIYNPFFVLIFSSDYSKSILLGSSVGSTMNNLNHRILNNLPFPLPPYNIQKNIVFKIEELMTLCDELEASIKANQEYTTLLYQTALKETLQPKTIEVKQEDLAIAAEPQADYEKGTVIELPKIQEKEDSHFVKRKVLATYIINQSLNDKQFGDVKFEKLLHLSDYFAIKRNLGQNYYQQAAGPYDNAFTHQYFQQVLNSKWFYRSKKGNQFAFSVGQNHSKSTNTYGYFSDEELTRVNEIISYFKNYDYEQPEIVSTLYAVWNNRIILNQEISNELLIEDFYKWDEQKKKYDSQRLEKALQWMRDKNFIPDGWGKVIEKPKTKKKK